MEITHLTVPVTPITARPEKRRKAQAEPALAPRPHYGLHLEADAFLPWAADSEAASVPFLKDEAQCFIILKAARQAAARMVRRFGVLHADADEAAQAAALALLEQSDGFESLQHAVRFAMNAAKRRIVDEVRRMQRRPVGQWDESAEAAQADRAVEAQADTSGIVREVMERLTDRERLFVEACADHEGDDKTRRSAACKRLAESLGMTLRSAQYTAERVESLLREALANRLEVSSAAFVKPERAAIIRKGCRI